jgi:hypothetical protein
MIQGTPLFFLPIARASSKVLWMADETVGVLGTL